MLATKATTGIQYAVFENYDGFMQTLGISIWFDLLKTLECILELDYISICGRLRDSRVKPRLVKSGRKGGGERYTGEC